MSYTNYSIPTKKEQNANTNLDQDLKLSRDQRYQARQSEIKDYVFKTLEIPQETINEYNRLQYDLVDILKDGELLCKLGQLLPIEPNPCRGYKYSKTPFKQMENISYFLKACEMIKLPHDEIFMTVDLFERKDPYQVVVTLLSFSRIANELSPNSFPTKVGPKVTKKKPPIPYKPLHLRA
ncbi:uncharacterized protein KQ657_005174 [Scheffersomyces spartinae]|uniref:Calponin-homology (CH) domain-containing protein n=1 Tax=Scheffersomyces spartinae TaxID=45513 RepID=A0A9P7VA29_9ASCO|nr:uncharacterized protein KQ657_005174 [Scheffersomyces spartinae]KAG7193975.1 hypothetical protein KQ657_005174 [Scheffersomyces spartinae]